VLLLAGFSSPLKRLEILGLDHQKIHHRLTTAMQGAR